MIRIDPGMSGLPFRTARVMEASGGEVVHVCCRTLSEARSLAGFLGDAWKGSQTFLDAAAEGTGGGGWVRDHGKIVSATARMMARLRPGSGRKSLGAEALKCLERLGVADERGGKGLERLRFADLPPAGRRMARWAGCIAPVPGMLVALDPFTGLDAAMIHRLEGILAALAREFGTLVVLVSRGSGTAGKIRSRSWIIRDGWLEEFTSGGSAPGESPDGQDPTGTGEPPRG